MSGLQNNLRELLPTDQKPESSYTKALRRLLPTGTIWGFITGTNSSLWQDNILGNAPEYQDNVTGAPIFQDNIPEDTMTAIASTKLGILMSCFGRELQGFQTSWYNLYTQSIPGLSTDLLPDWERNLGLPDKCTINPSAISLEERQCVAHLKYYSDQTIGMSKPFYIDYATSLGYTITIDEQITASKPFVVAPVGVDVLNSGSRVGNRLNSTTPVYTTFTITAGPNDLNQIARLQCRIGKLQPAHTRITWVVAI